jgi:hypothetical protein
LFSAFCGEETLHRAYANMQQSSNLAERIGNPLSSMISSTKIHAVFFGAGPKTSKITVIQCKSMIFTKPESKPKKNLAKVQSFIEKDQVSVISFIH